MRSKDARISLGMENIAPHAFSLIHPEFLSYTHDIQSPHPAYRPHIGIIAFQAPKREGASRLLIPHS